MEKIHERVESEKLPPPCPQQPALLLEDTSVVGFLCALTRMFFACTMCVCTSINQPLFLDSLSSSPSSSLPFFFLFPPKFHEHQETFQVTLQLLGYGMLNLWGCSRFPPIFLHKQYRDGHGSDRTLSSMIEQVIMGAMTSSSFQRALKM